MNSAPPQNKSVKRLIMRRGNHRDWTKDSNAPASPGWRRLARHRQSALMV